MKFEEECNNCKHFQLILIRDPAIIEACNYYERMSFGFNSDQVWYSPTCILNSEYKKVSDHHTCGQFVYDKKNDLPGYLFR